MQIVGYDTFEIVELKNPEYQWILEIVDRCNHILKIKMRIHDVNLNSIYRYVTWQCFISNHTERHLLLK